MKLDRVIAVRNRKTVFRDGDKCVKVFKSIFRIVNLTVEIPTDKDVTIFRRSRRKGYRRQIFHFNAFYFATAKDALSRLEGWSLSVQLHKILGFR